MSSQPSQPAFRTFKSILILSLVAAGCFAVIWLLAPVLFEMNDAVVTALVAGGLVAWLTSVVGLLPVSLMWRRGLMPTVVGYFLGAGLRIVICIVATVVAVARFDWPAGPWAVALMGMYLPLLFTEVALVGRFVWRINAQSGDGEDGDRETTPSDTLNIQSGVEALA